MSVNILLVDLDPDFRRRLNIQISNIEPELLKLMTIDQMSMSQFFYMNTSAYEVIITKMPENEALRLRIASKLNSMQKMIVISASAQYEDVRKAFRNGVYDYWLYPYEDEIIYESLFNLIYVKFQGKAIPEIRKRIVAYVKGQANANLDDFLIIFKFYTHGHKTPQAVKKSIFDLMSDLIIDICLKPLKFDKFAIANFCTNWIMSKEEKEYAFIQTIHRMAYYYNEVFLPQSNGEMIRRIVHQVLKPPYRDTNVKNVAESLFVNQSHLSVVFKKYTGIPLSAYIKRTKYYGAMYFLLEENYQTTDVMELMGFKDGPYFEKRFKAFTGTTVAAFVQKLGPFAVKNNHFQ
ncbi:DNA-binding response regulator [Fusibacter paucivorans]|uniref:DNA-binding response regulator n=1 Tax=Fusibacter paucivorans TaxID=76009 RepID=A0ABS5PP82_9FIRM|nr:DNA-binding response regulator [Fusibacter paucivorans]MBS7526161.1 DNA-binding response regulator [Fusibacter paucivorans]